MKKLSQFCVFVLLALSTLGFSGCENNSTKKYKALSIPSRYEAEIRARMDITMDPSLTQEERDLLGADLYKAMGLQIQVSQQSIYEMMFGSTDSQGVINYLSDRVHYVLPDSVKLETRMSHAAQSTQIYTMALNVGTALWFEALANAPQRLFFQIGETQVPVTSSRVGIVQLGRGYTAKKDDQFLFTEFHRIVTLVHEARHSDCTGGLLSSDLKKMLEGDDSDHQNCGHLHVRCPEGHNYDGAYACDAEAWGAYSVGAVYAASIAKNCANCSEVEKKLAVVLFADSLDRVIPVEDMLAGKLGAPDMSSSSVLH